MNNRTLGCAAYQDWNNPLNKIEAFYAGKMTERKNGAVVLDITTTETEAGQMYVVMPVPASAKAAIPATVQPLPWAEPSPQASQASSKPTPRAMRFCTNSPWRTPGRLTRHG